MIKIDNGPMKPGDGKPIKGAKRTLLACCSTAITDRTLWVPCDTAEEKRAARELEGLGLVIIRLWEQTGKTYFVTPTPEGIAVMREQAIGDERRNTVFEFCPAHGHQDFTRHPDGLRCPKCHYPDEVAS